MPQAQPFALKQVEAATWIIIDPGVPADDATRVVACIEEHRESGVVVTWLRPVPLATRFLDARMAVEELERWRSRPSAATRPTPIPRITPLAKRAAPSGRTPTAGR